MRAAQGGKVHIIRMLLMAGADPNIEADIYIGAHHVGPVVALDMAASR